MSEYDVLSASPKESIWMPLLLSTIAGLSTCIGAGIVFLFPKGNPVSSSVMSYSLALAGSVMITVSVISIGPECIFLENNGELTNDEWTKRKLISFNEFFHRLVSFTLGCGLYYCLSWFAFPEPDDILGLNNVEEKAILIDNMDTDLAFEDLSHISNENENDCNKIESGTDVSLIQQSNEQNSKRSYSPTLNKRRIPIISNKFDYQNKQSLFQNDPSQKINDYNQYTSKPSKVSKTFLFGGDLKTPTQKRAWRVALLLFVSLLFHNFPEGLAVAASTLSSTQLGITVTLGIMIHNIPEGIAIAIPCLKARPDQPWLAFGLASVSGLAEPFGAWIALVVLKWGDNRHNDNTENTMSLGNVLSFVAGIMVTVAVCELLPEGRRHYMLSSNESASLTDDEMEHEHDEVNDAWINKNGRKAYNGGLLSGFLIMVFTEWFIDS